MYPSRLTSDRGVDDIIVFGRATALRHVEGRDDASARDIKRRDWKRHWPHYVRVHHGEFVNGILGNGVSLYGLMEELGSAVFAATLANAQAGNGNTNPRRAYGRHPSVRLSSQGHALLDTRLEEAFARHGRLPEVTLAGLDWPPEWEATTGGGLP